MTRDRNFEIIQEIGARLFNSFPNEVKEATVKIQYSRGDLTTVTTCLKLGNQESESYGNSWRGGNFLELVNELWEYTHQNNFAPWNTLILKVTKEGKFNVQYIFDEAYDNRKKFFAKIYPDLGPDRLLARAVTKTLSGKTWRKIALTSVYTSSGREDTWYSLNTETIWEEIPPVVTGKVLDAYYDFLDDNHQYANHENPIEPFNVVEFQVWNREEFYMGGPKDEDYYEVNYGLDEELE